MTLSRTPKFASPLALVSVAVSWKGDYSPMRTLWVTGLVVVGLVCAVPAAAQDLWSVNASVGPSFGNVGRAFFAGGSTDVRVSDWVSLGAEVGTIARAPFEKTDEIATPLRGLVDARTVRVNSYHANGNLRLSYPAWTRVTPYVTGGMGFFGSTTTGSHIDSGATIEERVGERNFAENLGGGLSYRFSDRVGINVDYRAFFIDRSPEMRTVNRFTTAFTIRLK